MHMEFDESSPPFGIEILKDNLISSEDRVRTLYEALKYTFGRQTIVNKDVQDTFNYGRSAATKLLQQCVARGFLESKKVGRKAFYYFKK